MAAKTCLIVNADDFGRSPGLNRGIVKAHEQGIVTSASLMVRWPAALEAASYAQKSSSLSVGLHLDFGEWVYRDKRWVSLYEVVVDDDSAAVENEVWRQIACFRDLVCSDPTHIDSHQHRHLHEPARSVVVNIARELGVPVRACTPGIGYCGSFYGQTARGHSCPEAITADSLVEIISELPPGVTELGCHPGEVDGLGSAYGVEREQEVRTLCDPRVRAALISRGVELVSFRGLMSVREAARCQRN